MIFSSGATDTIVIGLMFGYGAGVASGLSLRPWISLPGIVVATVPTVIVMFCQPDVEHWARGVMITVFVVGGCRAMLTRYQMTLADINIRHSFAMLARSDHLTGLPNRLSLREHNDQFAQAASDGTFIAVHCLDLDRFKPVNDRFGHIVGDEVLRVVADRLLGIARECDFTARIGGDEFVIVQTHVSNFDEAETLARRIVNTISDPFVINGNRIEIAASVGYVLSTIGHLDLGHLIAGADLALCSVKRWRRSPAI